MYDLSKKILVLPACKGGHDENIERVVNNFPTYYVAAMRYFETWNLNELAHISEELENHGSIYLRRVICSHMGRKNGIDRDSLCEMLSIVLRLERALSKRALGKRNNVSNIKTSESEERNENEYIGVFP